MTLQERGFCLRCLLSDMPDMAEELAQVRLRIELLPEEHRTEDDEYRERLALCSACDKLLSGTCLICGCYVEYRAALHVRHCPDIPAKW